MTPSSTCSRLGTPYSWPAAGNDARLSDTRFPNDTYWDGIEYALYGKAGSIATTIPTATTTANGQALTSGTIYGAMLRPMRDITITTLAGPVRANGATGVTLARLGLYTATYVAGGVQYDLVARTGSTIATTGNSLNPASLDTTGGYPSSYTMLAGQTYAIAYIVVATGAGSRATYGSNTFANPLSGALLPGHTWTTAGQTDLLTTQTITASSSVSREFFRAEE